MVRLRARHVLGDPGEMSNGPASHDRLDDAVAANLSALLEHRRKVERARTIHERIADRIARFAGTMYFAYAHAVLFGVWLVWNSIPGVPHWDPYPFVMLAMFASVEAIFLSTFVLVSQNRMAQLADQRADLDLQINLLSEREITRVLALACRIAVRLGVRDQPADVSDLQRDVDPRELLETIDEASAEDEEQRPHRQRSRRGPAPRP
ncbi:DUF1003 domain-containing protein [Sandaracinus amylolyticus]|uniref:DUF1003 domain-containing protein n=1 Tax=Sandaracinus amylolyticus TaxID=927083 RepID=A0A0F6W9F0_9BACT|nr:DUF1003 domain-containing protein [Sandaracinus amylolyticus]AKF10767.1 hypothetical protein DB32_007916 [Sandaracinus amylolyticus]